MLVHRTPSPALRPFVKTLWACEETSLRANGACRELVLPTGATYLVFRLGHPLHLFGGIDDPVGRRIDHAVVGGARAAFYVRDISQPVYSVGAELLPGAAELLLGVPADELADRHTPVSDLWGSAAATARERLCEARDLLQRLNVFESLLVARLPKVHGLHPAVAHALERFETQPDIREVVAESGYSHRRFIELFRRAVGLSPKLYCRVRRFHRALGVVAVNRGASWVDLALAAGYSDQPHFNREFREFAGISPGQYREIAPSWSSHVPIRPI